MLPSAFFNSASAALASLDGSLCEVLEIPTHLLFDLLDRFHVARNVLVEMRRGGVELLHTHEIFYVAPGHRAASILLFGHVGRAHQRWKQRGGMRDGRWTNLENERQRDPK